MQGLWSLTSKVPDLLRRDLSPITKLFDHSNVQPIDTETPISPPIIVPTTSRPIPAPCPIQTNKPHPLTVSLPSTTSLHSDDFELTSLDNESCTKAKVTDEQQKRNLLYVQKAALQLYQQQNTLAKICKTSKTKREKRRNRPKQNRTN